MHGLGIDTKSQNIDVMIKPSLKKIHDIACYLSGKVGLWRLASSQSAGIGLVIILSDEMNTTA